MHHKNILLISATTRLHDRMRELTRVIDVSVALATETTFSQVPLSGRVFDLIIIDEKGLSSEFASAVESYAVQNNAIPRLFVCDLEAITGLVLPPQGRNDFILSTASLQEFSLRCSILLWPTTENTSRDLVVVDNIKINLATYQVYIDDAPVDLTYMDYLLLAFLANHPSRAYSREVLLQRVWGFEYCGGTRTVDVHVRRVRSKIGPQAAAHIETVRGVGYLFRV